MDQKTKQRLSIGLSAALAILIGLIVRHRADIANGISDLFSSSSRPAKTVMVDGINYRVQKSDRGRYAYVAPLKDDALYSGVVTVPATIKYHWKTYTVSGVDEKAFQDCKDLTEVILPDEADWFGEYAFAGSGIQTFHMPMGEERDATIGKHAFERCNNLKEVSIPAECSVMDYAFAHCNGLEKVVFEAEPEGHVSLFNFDISHYVHEAAFYGCQSLKTVEIHKSLFSFSTAGFLEDTYIFHPIFGGCPNLTELIIDEKCRVRAEDGVLFNKEGDQLYLCLKSKEGVYRIPEGVQKITSSAFMDCTGLTEVYLPKSLKEIGYRAFMGCSNLTIYYPYGTEARYLDDAFKGCVAIYPY